MGLAGRARLQDRQHSLLIPIASMYARCTAQCMAISAAMQALFGDCGIDWGGNAKDCLVDCLNPFNWGGRSGLKKPGMAAHGGKPGVVYRGTRDNKPYIGRTSNPAGPSGRGGRDGVDRSNAEILDRYPNTREGRIREQRQIDAHGGLDNLSNRRNEIAPHRRGEFGLGD